MQTFVSIWKYEENKTEEKSRLYQNNTSEYIFLHTSETKISAREAHILSLFPAFFAEI